jgi:hypothetical protein
MLLRRLEAGALEDLDIIMFSQGRERYKEPGLTVLANRGR